MPFFHKNTLAHKRGKLFEKIEIDKILCKYWIYQPYRQSLRYSMPNAPLKDIEKYELNYRYFRRQYADKLKNLDSYKDYRYGNWTGRCNLTGKDKVFNKWFRISTVPLRLLLKEGAIPGWKYARWNYKPTCPKKRRRIKHTAEGAGMVPQH
mmetsp:Transcript_79644/g.97447  ORF Transcript_79644/g.97447 Transcript_79644/m.97447 type:complete len:151 (+) Transcript_79644:14-466(+)